MFTPGPWKAVGSKVFCGYGTPMEEEIIAVCYSPEHQLKPEGEDEANARLIAAAPGLLRELKAVVNVLSNYNAYLPEIKAARKAMLTALKGHGGEI